MIAASRRRRIGVDGVWASGRVHAGSYCSLFDRTSLGTAELKSIPTNQTRLASKMDFARRRSAVGGSREEYVGVCMGIEA